MPVLAKKPSLTGPAHAEIVPEGEPGRRWPARVRSSRKACSGQDAALSFRFDIGHPNHVAPSRGLVRDELAEVSRRPAEHHAVKVAKSPLELGSTRAALISLLSLSTMSAAMFLGAPMPRALWRFIARRQLVAAGGNGHFVSKSVCLRFATLRENRLIQPSSASWSCRHG